MIITRYNDAPAVLDYQVICPKCGGWFEFEEKDKLKDNLIVCPHCHKQVNLTKVHVHKKKIDM